jgi:hypothetical protein
VSKQLLSVLAAHLSGLGWSHALAGDDASECAYYIVVFTLDTTLGVAASLTLHRALCRAAARRVAAATATASVPASGAKAAAWARLLDAAAAAVAVSGEYGDPPSGRIWGAQAAAWCVCVMLGACPPHRPRVRPRQVLR